MLFVCILSLALACGTRVFKTHLTFYSLSISKFIMKYICSQDSCQYSTDKKSNFNRHLKTHGLNPLDEEIKLYCVVEDCSQHFLSSVAYEKHFNVCPNIQLKRTIFEVPDVKAFEAFIVKIIESEKAFFKYRHPLHHICNKNSTSKPKIDEKTMCTSKKAEKYFGIGKRCPAYISGNITTIIVIT